MPVERAPEPGVAPSDEGQPIEVQIVDAEHSQVDPEPAIAEEEDFDANLAEEIDEATLKTLSYDLLAEYDADKRSREPWEQTYIKGLDLLGLKIEDRTEPWPGACGVFHPLLSEAVIRFQAQTIMELFPAGGPVKTKIVGKTTPEKESAAQRVQDDMNHRLTDEMTEFRPETEQMLWALPICGQAFKKVYYDPNLGRQTSIFVPAQDFVVSYGTSDLATSPRFTHIMRKTENEVKKLQVAGFYRVVEVEPYDQVVGKVEEKRMKMQGVQSNLTLDKRPLLLEMHVELDLAGYEDTDKEGEETGIGLPYVITIDYASTNVLSIRRNWLQDDVLKKKRMHFVPYTMIPGDGFYGYGFIHIMGSLAKSATSISRQLIDAGTLSNLPPGLKARGLRIKGDDSPIRPGEFRDVDIPGGAIRDNITFVPYKEPSAVLFQLLGMVADEGRRIASLADLRISDMNQNSPVGTTLAIMERSMKVMSAIQARLHASQKMELRLIADIIRDWTPAEYDHDTDEGAEIKQSDYDDVSILPVSDPNASSFAQRIMMYQAVMQLATGQAQGNTVQYDMLALHRQMLRALGVDNVDDILPDPEDIEPADPVAENMAIMTSKPVKAFDWQDHDAHISTHMAAMMDPKIQKIFGQNQMVIGAAEAHIAQHVAFKYRREIEKQLGVELPPLGEKIPPDIEVQLSSVIAKAAERVLMKDQAEEAQRKIQEQQQDPVIQQQQMELEIRNKEADNKLTLGMEQIKKDMHEIAVRQETEMHKIAAQLEIAGAKIGSGAAASKHKTDTAKEIAKLKPAPQGNN